MKNIILLVFALFSVVAFSQTQTENYIKNTTYKVASAISITNPTAIQANQNITYFDGLGRPIQQIAHQQSGSGKDIVTPIEYDVLGRQAKDYLPYVPNVPASLDYKATALTDVLNFPQYTGQNPFSEKELEASPLNRVLKQAAPGTDWALGSGHEIKLKYQTNTASDAVKLFTVTASWDAAKGLYDIPTSLIPADYLDYQLYKTITFDENTAATPTESNGSTVEFKNKQGQVVLKRTYGTVGFGTTNERYDTYYVYDQYGNLTFVVPPLVNAASTITQTILEGLCYQYKYDYRNRLVEKKLPGKDWEFIVYDKLDRPVLTQDANLRKTTNNWQFTKYDVFGRVAYTGIYPNADATKNARVAMQNYFNTQNSTGTKMYESRVPMAVGGGYSNISYTSDNFPKTSLILYTINYYDNYDFYTFNKDGITLPATTSSGDNIVNYNNAAGTQMLTKGLLTGTKIRVLDSFTTTNYWITDAIGYDAKGRPIYTVKNNKYLSTLDITESKLDFAGKVDKTITKHKRGSNNQIVIEDNFIYDHAGRLTKQTQSINGATPPEVIAANTYDELGQLISKKVGGKTTQLQTLDYAYNIRGWLTGINNDPTNNLVLNSSEKDLFGFKINYNTVENCFNYTGTALYNGNISETYWRTASDNVERKYGYKYDNVNRLRESIYQKPGIIIAQTLVTNAYDENITYDKNGNITSLQRNGNGDPQIGAMPIDDLTYVYMPNSPNQLLKVTDSPNGNDAQGFIDANKTDDYTYDDNGNLTTDKKKEITNITYNYFNLPTEITFRNDISNTIRYIYDALGTKQKKIVVSNGDTTDTYYAGTFQYVQSFEGGLPLALKFFGQPEGYVEPNGSSFKYVYQYKDHLGNVRLSYSDANNDGTIANSEIIEESNYYPFGLQHNGYNNTKTSYNPGQKKLFNGKELQNELGLNMYDYGARNYDPALGRWMNIDPLAEKSRRWSLYTYCYNNPIRFIDPDGMYSVGLNGTAKEQKEYTTMLHNSTGNNYSVDPKTNELKNDGADPNFSGTKSTELANTVDNAINSTTKYDINLTGGKGDDKTVFIDNFNTKTVDVADLKKIGAASTALQGAAIGHFVNEIQAGGTFNSAHNASLKVEGKIYGELIGDSSITTRTSYTTGGAVNGYQKMIYEFNSTNKFEFKEGATSVSKATTIQMGGISIPSTEITTNPTGELKSVKKLP
ncbi:MAG: DUF6443 domain-containing protein [Bacteroidota bacterium]